MSTAAGSGGPARTMLESTMGLYAGLQAFFATHPALQRRPFFAAGESYAGKFVPSLGASPHCRLKRLESVTWCL